MSTQTVKSLTLEEKCDYFMGRRNRTLAGAGLTLSEIEPLTQNQVAAFESEKQCSTCTRAPKKILPGGGAGPQGGFVDSRAQGSRAVGAAHITDFLASGL